MFPIFKPEAADFPEIVNVWERSVRATHHFLAEQDIQYFRPLVLNQYLHLVDLYCVKDELGKITGFIGLSDGKIEMLFIDPGLRGTGIGKRLLQFAIGEHAATQVDVNEQNEQAVGFYKYFGFKVVSRSEFDGTGKPYPLLHMVYGK